MPAVTFGTTPPSARPSATAADTLHDGADDRLRSVTRRPRWGILATGGIAELFTHDLRQAGFDVRAVGSRSQTKAESFAARHGIPKAHGGYDELVDDPDVDVVYIATPPSEHAANAVLALNAGKHVLIEKPFTMTGAQARRVADLARARKLIALEAMWTRFLPHVARVREIIAAGTLGDLRSFTAQHMQLLSDDPAHRLNARELGGGALLDLGIYPVSFAFHLFGAPQTVLAAARLRPTGVDAEVGAVFGYPDGCIATMLSASDARGSNIASIIGTRARIDIDATWFTPTTFRVIGAHERVLDAFTSAVSGRGLQLQAFEVERMIESAETESPLMPLDESVQIMGTLDEIRRQIGVVYPDE